MEDWIYDQGGYVFPTTQPSTVPADHPLRSLFASLVEKAFLTNLGVHDTAVNAYLTNVLADFTHMRGLYKVRDLTGKPLEEVADMLLEADIRLGATSFNREREVHKHIGDFVLFWTGVFPDALPRLQGASRKDILIDYVKQGKSSYAIAASHDYGAYREQSGVLHRLSDEFELCMLGLNIVRGEMDKLPKAPRPC